MGDETKCIVNAMIVGVILNLVLPLVVTPFATKEEAMQWVTAEELGPIHNMRRANAKSKLIVIKGFEES